MCGPRPPDQNVPCCTADVRGEFASVGVVDLPAIGRWLWRATVATEWTIVNDLVLSGGAVLRLASGAIVDPARREDLNALEGARAVAFDEAQERAGLVLFQSPD